MNTSFEIKAASDEWYTPRELVDSLGEFDLDPCAPVKRLWDTAKKHFTKEDDGLSKDWEGKRVWLNPPYSKPLIDLFVKKMAENNNGIALLYNRCDNVMFQEVIFKKSFWYFLYEKAGEILPSRWNTRRLAGHRVCSCSIRRVQCKGSGEPENTRKIHKTVK